MSNYVLAVNIGDVKNFVEVDQDDFFKVVDSVSDKYNVMKKDADFGSVNYFAATDQGTVLIGFTL